MKIAFFDSGIGGLSVLNEAKDRLDADFLFYADKDNVPYGEKPKEDILKYVDDAVSFLINEGANAIVLACNTATSVAAKILREKYDLPIIGMEPAIKYALKLNDEKRVLVIATPVTVKGEKMKELIGRVDKAHLTDLLALPKLVTFAEVGEFESDNVTKYLKEKLTPYDFEKYSAVVLGCTHFNYFKDTLRNLLPQSVSLIDGNEGTVNELKRRLDLKKNPSGENSTEYFYSGKGVTDKNELQKLNNLLLRLNKMQEIK